MAGEALCSAMPACAKQATSRLLLLFVWVAAVRLKSKPSLVADPSFAQQCWAYFSHGLTGFAPAEGRYMLNIESNSNLASQLNLESNTAVKQGSPTAWSLKLATAEGPVCAVLSFLSAGLPPSTSSRRQHAAAIMHKHSSAVKHQQQPVQSTSDISTPKHGTVGGLQLVPDLSHSSHVPGAGGCQHLRAGALPAPR